MASPHASSFICLPFANKSDIVDAYTAYFSVCIGSALIGVLGALLFLAQVLRLGRDPYLGGAPNSQRRILILLAVSDLFADIGVIARSIYWLSFYRKHHLSGPTKFDNRLPQAVGGAIVESWVFFWYLATYFWTFFFAVDVYNSKHGGKWKLWCSHLFTWLFCTVYVTGSVASLWACPPYTSCTEDSWCVISHFMCTFGPIVIFMAALPLFYVSTWRRMNKTAKAAPAVDIWKKEKKVSGRKILSIILVFYVCWIVNILDGVMLIAVHTLNGGERPASLDSLYNSIYSYKYIYVVWLLEAILNPLQGLFNAIAYGNLGVLCYECVRRCCDKAERFSFSSWSGEYIDVDFRVGRGNIRSTKKRQSTS